MGRPQVQMSDTAKRLLWFLLAASSLAMGAGVYFQSRTYFFIGLLGVGVLIGGLARWLLERYRSS